MRPSQPIQGPGCALQGCDGFDWNCTGIYPECQYCT
jgi:hypothetical protein